MAQGDFTLFNSFKEKLGKKVFSLDTNGDTFKVGLIKNVVNSGYNPISTTSDPTWGIGGSTNLSLYEVVPDGNYTSGGYELPAITNTWNESGGVLTWDNIDNPIWDVDALSPVNASYAIIYDDTATNKDCMGFIDLRDDPTTEVIDMSLNNLTITFDAVGIFTLV